MRVVLGLGSNLGDRARHLKRAVTRLVHGPDPVLVDARLARVYTSPALVPPGAPESWDRPYLNTALSGDVALAPDALLARIKALEVELGRRPSERWAPRPVDIDILWWDADPVARPGLTVPHPGALDRSFVLEPLADLRPQLTLAGATVAEHARRRRAEEPESARPDPEAGRRVRFPHLMGILNVTPDSFSDGGRFHDPDDALRRAEAMLDGGADTLDVGAESTRPDGAPVDPAEEWRRLEPVLEGLVALRRTRPFRLSLDSRHPAVVLRGLERGVDVVNDVTGFRDPAMRDAARGSAAELVFMHSLSVPVVRGERLPAERDPVEVVLAWARERAALLEREGVDRRRLVLDPGIGFGKSPEQSWALLEGVERLHAVGLPLLVGHSRKSFLGEATGLPAPERDEATVALSLQMGPRGVEELRVHDPALHARRFRAAMEARPGPWVPVGPQSSSLTRPSSGE